MTVFIVFGVSGSGKSTIGKLLAEKLGLKHFDADDYHHQSNIEKMRRGEPLDDEDRLPWLHKLADKINVWSQNKGAVLSCSALKEKYRRLLGSQSADIKWIVLDGDRDVIRQRLEARKDHFFDVTLLDSQIKDLEIPEYAQRISIEHSPNEIVDIIMKKTVHG